MSIISKKKARLCAHMLWTRSATRCQCCIKNIEIDQDGAADQENALKRSRAEQVSQTLKRILINFE